MHGCKSRLIGRSRYLTPTAPKDQHRANARRLARHAEYDFNPIHRREAEARLKERQRRGLA